MTSPNYPDLYPNNHHSTQTIQVAEGKIIKMTFTEFHTDLGDRVEIMDGDGTNLTPLCKHGLWGDVHVDVGLFLGCRGGAITVFTSNSNIVNVTFHTDNTRQSTGWKLEWTER